ncbi:MAG TPA: hypothetical protein VGI22_19680 [Xanthobacteraceae bacterium]|jgi:hypothetical protein
MQKHQYDRAAEDVGNIVGLGHVNTAIPDQRLATLFYVSGLGLTRDPFLNTSTDNMWINVGQSQFHLPTGGPEILRGITGLVLPDRAALLERLERIRGPLQGTCFAFRESNDGVETLSPWGNRINCHAPDPHRFGPVVLGMAYVLFDVRPGTAARIARFYREILQAPATDLIDDERGRRIRVMVGARQYLVFRESDETERSFDGHHVQIDVADFSGPHRRLMALGLVTEESDAHQYRFKDIVDLDTRQVLFTIEHEVRSMQHPMYARPLVNRDPAQTAMNYRPGRDNMAWSME